MSEATATEAAPAVTETTDRGVKKTLQGVVVSDKAQKTIVVQVTRRVRHPVYGKEVKISKKYHAHDEKSEAKTGDNVRIIESRPLSRLKRWRLVEVVTKAQSSS
jgi:small subunit ribosomal protein S17